MKMDKSMFCLRSGSNLSLQPTREELRMFLQSKKKDGGRELHCSDLAAYNEVLESVLSFRQRQLQGALRLDEQKELFYGALSHSFFFNSALKSAVEQYKYQLHVLRTIDYKKPPVFIIAAREAMRLLNSRKKTDAARNVNIQDTADERKRLLETFNSRWPALVEELGHIAQDIRDTLLKIANRCETSIVVLGDNYVARTKETQLIEDIKACFKEQLIYELHDGRVTRQRLDEANIDAALLSNEISGIFRENILTLTRLYKSIYAHSMKSAREIGTLMAENRKKKNRSFAEEVKLFTRIEKVLDSLVSGKQFEFKETETKSETTHRDIFLEKRKELFGHLIEVMQKDRRSCMRRSIEKRRSSDVGQSRYPVQRSGSDRRTRKDRRRDLSLSA